MELLLLLLLNSLFCSYWNYTFSLLFISILPLFYQYNPHAAAFCDTQTHVHKYSCNPDPPPSSHLCPFILLLLSVNEFIYLICLLSVCLLITVSCSTPFQCVDYYLFNHQSKWLTPIYSLTFFYSIPISLFIPLKLRLVACFLRVSFIHYNNHLLGSDPDHSLSTLFLIHSSMHHCSLNRSIVYIFVLPWSLYSLNSPQTVPHLDSS